MSEELELVTYQEAVYLSVAKLVMAGVRRSDAQTVAEVLVHANLRGVDSHGVLRVEHYVNKLKQGGINPLPNMQVKKTGVVTAVVDGDDGLGHCVAHLATETAIELALEHGVGMVGGVNSSHCGALSYFAQMAVEKNLVCMIMSNTDSAAVPFGGKTKFFGTNPIAFGVPARKNAPIILDMATTTVAYGKIIDHRMKGKSLPIGWAVDEAGRDVTDPDLAKGMLHFGGAKGFGLALMVDVFSSLLMGAAFGPHVEPMYADDLSRKRKLGQYFCVINPSSFTDPDMFLTQMDAMIDEIHALPPAEGFQRVMVPGEPECLQEALRREQGIPLPKTCLSFLRS